jgi:hypothetical protein
LLAARFPRPDVRDLVRRLPAQAGFTLNVERASEEMPTEASPPGPMAPQQKMSIESRSSEPLAAHVHAPGPGSGAAEPPKPGRLEPLSADRYGVHFTADGEFRELLERVRGLAGHRLPSGDLMTLLKRGLEAYERELMKERFALGRNARGSSGPTPVHAAPAASSQADLSAPAPPEPELSTSEPPNLDPQSTPSANPKPKPKPKPNLTRHCPAAVARAVFVRDGRRCTYVSPDGRRCSERRCLELDHVEPWAVGGESTIENLRLRCRAHNQRYARQY